jgi:hypothetical protein
VLQFSPGAVEGVDVIGLQQLAYVFLEALDDTGFKVGGDDSVHPPALGSTCFPGCR